MEVVVGGCHGGWRPEDGFVKVPSGTHVYLYAEPGVPQPTSVDAAGAQLSEAELHDWAATSSMFTFEGGDVIPDYATEDHDPLIRERYFEGNPDPNVVLVGGGGMLLSEILAQSQGSNIHWFSCQSFVSAPDPDAYEQAVASGDVKLANM
ncbi:MAG: hypothetical protein KGQ66_09265 [Acidobacteriota bacterium]|jgi:hypothetical protein|nr:hypothetical protein [Acidobacteriota bacterium]